VRGIRADVREFLADEDWTRRTATRVGAGSVLVLLGAATFVATTGSFAALRQGLLGATVLSLGIALIVAPWLMRLSRDLGAERRERIRNEERALLAAHLHDSVLQTLAIIQKRAHDPRDVVTLARRQERELQAWLYGGTDLGATATSFAAAIAAAADQVEADHSVRVEIVQVGDVAMSDTVATIVAAAREAMVNAAKHAKVDEVSVYAEVIQHGTTRSLEVFVRDRGVGFDPSVIAADRHGVADSIRARMERVGGRADVRSEIGEGTEVQLEVALETAPDSLLDDDTDPGREHETGINSNSGINSGINSDNTSRSTP
jgi:signal transduction histidine kinase